MKKLIWTFCFVVTFFVFIKCDQDFNKNFKNVEEIFNKNPRLKQYMNNEIIQELSKIGVEEEAKLLKSKKRYQSYLAAINQSYSGDDAFSNPEELFENLEFQKEIFVNEIGVWISNLEEDIRNDLLINIMEVGELLEENTSFVEIEKEPSQDMNDLNLDTEPVMDLVLDSSKWIKLITNDPEYHLINVAIENDNNFVKIPLDDQNEWIPTPTVNPTRWVNVAIDNNGKWIMGIVNQNNTWSTEGKINSTILIDMLETSQNFEIPIPKISNQSWKKVLKKSMSISLSAEWLLKVFVKCTKKKLGKLANISKIVQKDTETCMGTKEYEKFYNYLYNSTTGTANIFTNIATLPFQFEACFKYLTKVLKCLKKIYDELVYDVISRPLDHLQESMKKGTGEYLKNGFKCINMSLVKEEFKSFGKKYYGCIVSDIKEIGKNLTLNKP